MLFQGPLVCRAHSVANYEAMSGKPTIRSIVEGTLAQMLGGSLASTIVLGLASFGHYMAAGFESAFGTLLGMLFYLTWKGLRKR